MAIGIEEVEQLLRARLATAGVRLEDGPAAVLPVFEAFCREPVEAESDMVLWEVGTFHDWSGPDRSIEHWTIHLCRQFECGLEEKATDDEPAGFFQLSIEWHYPPETSSEQGVWWHTEHEPPELVPFFRWIASTPTIDVAATASLAGAHLVASWV